MPQQTRTLRCDSPEATHALATALARVLEPGDTVLLEGPVGAGKTHFARGVILALLDVAEDVPSPTYTLVQAYLGRKSEIWHTDLYRLTDVSELEELGLFDAFESAICLVEWPDRLGQERPGNALLVTLHCPGPELERDVTFSWTAEKWHRRLEELFHG
ncbi:tRNA (adenosine(37)-N6)-threonylcarbamoyltransferase complex ATPase subunit type 1 TsaE [Roseovarius salis]|uniref:tRNA (adenosine(37)-N6)-threonylcarbamoyltransferase complex ATPase subunit type 1 TsaE n=1 Tax=Roseovarius salis TaxID=3376063 RepID=UPI0037C6510E